MLSHLLDGHPNINSFPEDISFLYAFYPNPSRWGDFNAQKSRLRSVIEKVTIPMENRLFLIQVVVTNLMLFGLVLINICLLNLLKIQLAVRSFILSWTEYTDFDHHCHLFSRKPLNCYGFRTASE